MGGFPSHDAAGFIFTTAVQPPHTPSASGSGGAGGGSVSSTAAQPSATTATGGVGGGRNASNAGHPPGTGPVEICLIPLFRRYFNDNNKKLKDSVASLYINRHVAGGVQPPVTPAGPPGPPWMSAQSAPSGNQLESTPSQTHTQRVVPSTMEHLLGDVEISFYANGGFMLQAEQQARAKADLIKAARERKRNALNEALFSVGWGGKEAADHLKSAEAKKQLEDIVDDEDSPILQKQPNDASRETKPAKAAAPTGTSASASDTTARAYDAKSAPVLRPVPCAVCIIEPEGSGRGRGGGGGGGGAGGGHHAHNNSAPLLVNGVPISDWVTVQGRKVHCIGYLSCFATQNDAYTYHTTSAPLGSPETLSPKDFVGVSPQTSSGTNGGGSGLPTPQQHRIVDVDEKGLDVYFELVLEHEERFAYMIEPIVLLASMAFRSQFLTCSMWQQSFWSTSVEEAYFHHLQLLNVRVRVGKTQYSRLKSLYQQFPLMELVDDLGFTDRWASGQSTSAHQDGETDAALTSGAGDSTSVKTLHADHGADTAEANEAAKGKDALNDDDEEDDGEEDGQEREEEHNDADRHAAAAEEDKDGVDDSNDDDEHDEDELKGTNGEDDDGGEKEARDDGRGSFQEGDDDLGSAKHSTTDKPAEATSTGNSASVTGRRNRSHRNRRRQRRVRVPLARDDVYRQTISTLPTFRLYRDPSKGSTAPELLSQTRSGSASPGVESDDSEDCTVEDADGIEVCFEGGILARFTKLVAETASFETVKNCYVRCDMGPLMKERRHLVAAHREALQEYLDHQEEEERLFGSEQIVLAFQQWIKEGKRLEEQRRLMPEAIKVGIPAGPHSVAAGLAPAVALGIPGVAGAPVNPAMVAAAPAPMMMYLPGYGMVGVGMSQGAASVQQARMAPQPTIMMAPQPQPMQASPQYVLGPGGQVMMVMQQPAMAAPPAQAYYQAYQPSPMLPQPQLQAQTQTQQSTPTQTPLHSPSAVATRQQSISRPSTPPQQPQYPPQPQAIFPQQQIYSLPQPVQQQPQGYMYVIGPGGQMMLMPVGGAAASPQMALQVPQAAVAARLPPSVPPSYATVPLQQLLAQQQQQQQQQQRVGSTSGTPSFHSDPAIIAADPAASSSTSANAASMPTIKVGGVVLPAEGTNKQAPIPQSAIDPPPSYGSLAGYTAAGSTQRQAGGPAMPMATDSTGVSGGEDRRRSGNVQDLLEAALGKRAQGGTTAPGWSVNGVGTSAAGPAALIPGLQIGGSGVHESSSTSARDHHQSALSAFSPRQEDDDQTDALEAVTAAIRAIEGGDVLFGMAGLDGGASGRNSDEDDASSTSQRLNEDFFF